MKTKPLDRRTKRTRRLLREALFSLILEKGYEAVTVEDITRQADLGRTTFYLHYRDKEDLLLKSIEGIADALAAEIGNLEMVPDGDGEIFPREAGKVNPVLIVFQHAAQNAPVYRTILRGEGAYKASNRIREITSRYIADFLSERLRHDELQGRPAIPLVVIANYYAGSLLGMLTWWLENEMPYSPEEMAEMFRRLLFWGLPQATKP